MRDPNRLDALYDELKKMHKEKCPDQRFGQMISNFFGWVLGEKKCSDIWFPEENEWIKWIKEFYEGDKNVK